MTIPELENLRQELFDAFDNEGGLFPATLNKKTVRPRNRANIGSPEIPAIAPHQCQAVATHELSKLIGTQVVKGGTVISILGGSLPESVIPENGDSIDIDGSSFTVVEVGYASTKASFQCRVERT